VEVHGRSLAEGIPKKITLSNEDIREAIQEPLSGIIAAVRAALEKAPPELAGDISERGIVLTGGGALLKDLDKLLQAEIGLPVIVAEDPLTCVARGGGRALEVVDSLGGEFISRE
jgi:rod shape-determining protein MreB